MNAPDPVAQALADLFAAAVTIPGLAILAAVGVVIWIAAADLLRRR